MNHFYFPVRYGMILMSWSNKGLQRLEWSENRLAPVQKVQLPPILALLVDQIRGFFYEGEPISPIAWSEIDQSDWTDFQRDVYQSISKIPFGETRTYGWVAKQLGKTSASRAVGQALRKNPLPILIPCHRITTTHGIGGFMGSLDPNFPEVKLKRRLLNLEEEYQSPHFSFLNSNWMDCNQVTS